MPRFAGILFVLMATPACGDLLAFRDGGMVNLPATVRGDQVELQTPDGPRTFPRDNFRQILPDPDPDSDPIAAWPARRDAALKTDDPAARFAAAWWALEHGLTAEAVALLDQCRAGSDAHPPTARSLAMLDALRAPLPDGPAGEPDLAAVQRALRPGRFQILRGSRVVLIHQLDEGTARERVELADRVVTTFCLTLAAQGLRPTAPARRLVSVCFAERDDYRTFLDRNEATAFGSTQGFYHPTLRAVFAFDAPGDVDQKRRRQSLANRRRAGAPPAELDRLALLIDLDRRAIDLGILAHETVHQLAVATEVEPRPDAFPVWLHEGLAAQFEVVRGGRWAGVGRTNDLRLPDWRTIRPAPRLLPRLRDHGLGQGYRRDAYAESWALVFFLRKTRPDQFRTYLELLRTPTPTASGSTDPHHLAAFRKAFGTDLAGLEAEWRRYVGELTIPFDPLREKPSP